MCLYVNLYIHTLVQCNAFSRGVTLNK